jgi:microcystin-dependent protein
VTDPYLGQVALFGFNFAPQGWALCQGQILAIAQNTALFSLLGTTYGGNGQTTFALPDLQGRVPIGVGQGPGLSDRDMGEEAGVENVTLTTAEMPAHTHFLNVGGFTVTRNCRSGAGPFGSPAGNLPAGEAGAATTSYSSAAPDANMQNGAIAFAGSITVAPNGGSLPHNNLQPYLTLNYCICTAGIFPQRP